MKKVKTIVASLILMLASIFVSACSCGDTADLEQVYARDFNIQCILYDANSKEPTSSSTVEGYMDGEILVVNCHKGDTIVIEYTIEPSDSTTVQVNFSDFSSKGFVVAAGKEEFRSKSAKERVTFVAQNKTAKDQPVELTFTLASLNKKAICKFYVLMR